MIENISQGPANQKITIQGVLFDLGNTLVSYYQPSEFHSILRECIGRCCRYLACHGNEYDENELYEQAKGLTRARGDLAVFPLAARLKILFGKDLQLTGQQLSLLMKTFMEPIFSIAKPDEAAIPILQVLRAQGIKTGILSNAPWGSPSSLWRAELERHGILENIDLALFCSDIGWRKPNPAIFTAALQKLGLQPRHTLFVGDDPEWDIAGARNAGLIPVLLTVNHQAPEAGTVTIKKLDEILTLL